MAKVDVLDILRVRNMSPLEFNFESLWIPPMHFYLTPQDVNNLRSIATSVRLSSKINQKYKMIDDIMRFRGFKRFSAGTNRVVYSYLEDPRFLVKVAVDKVGMQDNPLEYENQFLLKPFVTKMFYISPCGTVGFCERVLPIKNKGEFKGIASDVFDVIVNKILGNYVVEDVGTKYFMNWGIRMGFGPVLLDYPYVYKLDGNKLFCSWVDPTTNTACDGEIDYDAGFNHLVCTRCGKRYLATNLRDDSIDNKIVIKKGGIQMRVIIKKGDRIIGEPVPVDDVMHRPSKPNTYKSKGLVVSINNPNKEVITKVDNIKENDTNIDETTYITPNPVSDSVSELTDTPKEVDTSTVKSEELADNSEDVIEEAVDANNDDSVNAIREETTTLEDPDNDHEDVFASDGISTKPKKRMPPRDEKGKFISTEGSKKGRKDRTRRNTGSRFIPNEY